MAPTFQWALLVVLTAIARELIAITETEKLVVFVDHAWMPITTLCGAATKAFLDDILLIVNHNECLRCHVAW